MCGTMTTTIHRFIGIGSIVSTKINAHSRLLPPTKYYKIKFHAYKLDLNKKFANCFLLFSVRIISIAWQSTRKTDKSKTPKPAAKANVKLSVQISPSVVLEMNHLLAKTMKLWSGVIERQCQRYDAQFANEMVDIIEMARVL